MQIQPSDAIRQVLSKVPGKLKAAGVVGATATSAMKPLLSQAITKDLLLIKKLKVPQQMQILKSLSQGKVPSALKTLRALYSQKGFNLNALGASILPNAKAIQSRVLGGSFTNTPKASKM